VYLGVFFLLLHLEGFRYTWFIYLLGDDEVLEMLRLACYKADIALFISIASFFFLTIEQSAFSLLLKSGVTVDDISYDWI